MGVVDLHRKRLLLERKRAILQSREELIPFARYMAPAPDDRANPNLSAYEVARHHKVIAAALEEVEAGRIRRLIISCPPRHGKRVFRNTLVPTPEGMKLHGDLRSGDHVFGIDGKSTLVTHVTEPTPGCVPVTFSNGEVIWCDPGHLWTVRDRGRSSQPPMETLETREIQARGLWAGVPGKRGSRARFQLPDVRGPVEHPERNLPIDPYFLGVWLGNGNANSSVVAFAPEDRAYIDPCITMYAVRREWVQENTGVGYVAFGEGEKGERNPLRDLLRSNALLGDKHVPEIYLRASVAQRKQLLAGLIDTDGHVEPDTGRIRFVNTNERLIEGVFDLAAGLGYRPYVTSQDAARSTSGIQGRQIVFTVGFQPTEGFGTKLPRKQPQFFARRRRISIREIGALDPEKMASCIKIDREDGLYLIGRTYIPTHNSRLASMLFPAWFLGRNPLRSVVFATYNDKYAVDIGGAVKTMLQSPLYAHVFPKLQLAYGGASSDRLRILNGGDMFCVGVGGTLTGRGGDINLIDDPIKNRQEADSIIVRDKLWNWYQNVFRTRMMTKDASLVIIATRWNEDDLIGRHIDPQNPYYNEEEAQSWKIINLPALAEDDDPLGRAIDEPLWPARFDTKFLLDQRRSDPRGFTALYQGRPTPAQGSFFRAEFIRTYDKMSDMPAMEGMRFYGACDLAVATRQENDKSCLMVIGVDENDNMWIMPDLVWSRMPADMSVERIIALMQKYKPMRWWAEKGSIQKSIGPFLRKRMLEKRVFCYIDEITPTGDKQARAQSINARMGMGRVYFPRFARWFVDARDEILKFPHGGRDDFVDTLSLMGLGLMKQQRVKRQPKPVKEGAEEFTLGWVKENTKRAEREARRGGGW